MKKTLPCILERRSIKAYFGMFMLAFTSVAFSQGNTVYLEKCNVRVTFSGVPTEVTSEIPRNARVPMGLQSLWGYSNVLFGKVTQERAVCMCPPEPTLSGALLEINKTSTWYRETNGIGTALLSPLIDDISCKNCKLTKTTSPKSAPKCFLIQEVMSEGDPLKIIEQAQVFFASTASTVEIPVSTSEFVADCDALKKEVRKLSWKLLLFGETPRGSGSSTWQSPAELQQQRNAQLEINAREASKSDPNDPFRFGRESRSDPNDPYGFDKARRQLYLAGATVGAPSNASGEAAELDEKVRIMKEVCKK